MRFYSKSREDGIEESIDNESKIVIVYWLDLTFKHNRLNKKYGQSIFPWIFSPV